jgi:hypothetical protein
VNIYARLENGRLMNRRAPVPPAPAELRELTQTGPKPDMGVDRLLE